ncbi:MAG: helix-turn-helix domain-containing protein [Bacteroidales bacterium]|nr:helix-turn-helix domain-containing protein [Bacteroidales bacterium]
MEQYRNELTLLNTRCWADVAESLKQTFKGWVKEAVEEVINDKLCNANLDDKRLNAEELCKRWSISRNTLYNWEKDGIIEPLPLGGRRKIYSMRDVLNAESEGLVRTAC